MLNKIALQLFSDFSFFIRLCSTDPKKIQNESGFYIPYLYCIYKSKMSRTGDRQIDFNYIWFNQRLRVTHCYKNIQPSSHGCTLLQNTNIIGTLCISIRTLCISIKPLCISLERLLNVSQLEDCWMYLNWKTAECIAIERLLNVSQLEDCWMYLNWKTAECISIGRLLNLSQLEDCWMYLN